MTFLRATGFEFGKPDAPNAPTVSTDTNAAPDGKLTWGTLDTTTKRTGTQSLKLTAALSTANQLWSGVSNGATDSWVRFYIYFDPAWASSGVTADFFTYGASVNNQFGASLSNALALQCYWIPSAGGKTNVGSPVTLTKGQWLKFAVRYKSTAGSDGAYALYIDDVLIVENTAVTWGASLTGTILQLGRGPVTTAGGVYVDDIEEATTMPGSGYVVLMKPTADSQAGSWTAGGGGTTNLWQAVSTIPPAGIAALTNTTQIRTADASGNNATDEYRASCGTFTAAGVAAGDTITGIQAFCNHGEEVSTGTKTGSFGFQANPAVAYTTFTYGNDNGALGSYATGWMWTATAVVDAPSVTLGSSLILAVRKTDTGTRFADVDWLGAYVAVASAPASGGLPLRTAYRRQMHLLTR